MPRATIILVVLAASLSAQAAQRPFLLDQEAYAVYGSVLVNLRLEHAHIALLAETRADSHCEKHVPSGWQDVVADFVRVNAHTQTMLGGFDLGRPYQLVSAEELALANKESGRYLEQRLADLDPPPRPPFAKYPGGRVFVMSGVGFDAERTRAMFMLQQTCGQQCWEGEQILRVKIGGQWLDAKDVPERCAWIT